MPSNFKTPGVYINEINAFPSSVVNVPTAIPAFIGYTAQAIYDGKSLINIPQKITSFVEFEQIYGSQQKNQPTQYYFTKENLEITCFIDPNTCYYLYNSIKLFYENGGADAYIVAVGSYGTPSNRVQNSDAKLVNKNIILADLLKGVELLADRCEPTMYICPDATLLETKEYGILCDAMLKQCDKLQSAISIFDLIGGNKPDPINYTKDIENFRATIGNDGLSYGVAYYPFVNTNMINQLNYTSFFGGDLKSLMQLLSKNEPKTLPVLNHIEENQATLGVDKTHQQLLHASKLYQQLISLALNEANSLPASAAMAGVMTTVDNTRGVWAAPANVEIIGATSLPIKLSDQQQENLNIDPITGKSINAIRAFNGLGILVWGARTLDGNSMDMKYVNIRRTLIMIEQSCKNTMQAYIFEVNNKNTWEAVKAMINSFLTSIWKMGGLAGASPKDAFSVSCGLGSTMTNEDILNGYINLTVLVALTHPAEFITISLTQQMQKS